MKLLRMLAFLAAVLTAPAFATQTVLLAPGQTAATSSTIACSDTCTLSLNTATAPNPVDIEVDIISNSVPQKIYDLTPWPGHPVMPLGPGTYQVIRKNITAYGQNAGVTIDLGPATSGVATTVNQGTSPWITSSLQWPAALGQTTMALSTSFTLASDQSVGLFASGAKQDTGNTSLASIATNTAAGATAANQATANSSLATIATNTTAIATAAKQDTGNASLATIATNSAAQATAAKQDVAHTDAGAINTTLGTPMQNSGGSVTANIGTAGTLATAAKQDTIIAALGTPFQAGGSVGISGTLPAFAAPPAVAQSGAPWSVIRADTTSTGNTINCTVGNAAYTLTNTNGIATDSFSVAGLTACAGTLTIEASDDGGTTWAAVNGVAPGTGALFTTLTADQQFRVNAAARGKVRLRVSTPGGAGNITIASIATAAPGLFSLSSKLPDFQNAQTVTANAGTNLNTSALALEATQVAGNGSLSIIAANSATQATAANQTNQQQTVGSTKAVRSLAYGATGIYSQAPTYRYVASGYTAYATPTDLFCLSNPSSTVLVIPTQVIAGMTATASILETLTWTIRSTLDTGGTPTTPALSQYDSGDAAPVGVVTTYGSAPALGTSSGNVAINVLSVPAVTAAPGNFNLHAVIGAGLMNTPYKNITLHVNQAVCANWGGAAWPTGGTQTLNIQWVEVPVP